MADWQCQNSKQQNIYRHGALRCFYKVADSHSKCFEEPNKNTKDLDPVFLEGGGGLFVF